MAWEAVEAFFTNGGEVVWELLTSGWDGAKILQVAIAAVPTSYAIYKALRFAEARLFRRLDEFLDREEKRLATARENLKVLAIRPGPATDLTDPSFRPNELNRALVSLKWGRARKAESRIRVAADDSAEKRLLAKRKLEIHAEQQGIAHLLLGALADSRGDHQAALAQFEAAIQLDEEDIEAVEYAGVQWIKLGSATLALQHFERMSEIALSSDDKLMQARALRHKAKAYECLPQPQYKNARGALRAALKLFPSGSDRLEVAEVHEQLGIVRQRLGAGGAANQSYAAAQNIYWWLKHQEGGKNKLEAEAGLQRTLRAIAELDQQANVAGDDSDDDTLPPIPRSSVALPMPTPPANGPKQTPPQPRLNS